MCKSVLHDHCISPVVAHDIPPRQFPDLAVLSYFDENAGPSQICHAENLVVDRAQFCEASEIWYYILDGSRFYGAYFILPEDKLFQSSILPLHPRERTNRIIRRSRY